MFFEAWIALIRGDWVAARAALEQALTLNTRIEGWQPNMYAQVLLARLCLAEGDWAAATAGGEAATLVRGSSDLQALRWASSVQAEIEILEGRPETGRDRLVPLLDRSDLEEADATALLPVLAWAQLELEQVDQAADTVVQALRRARPEAMRLILVEALRIQALVALRQERWDEAARGLEEGVTLARSIPYPYAEARLLRVSGELHRAQGEPGRAREQCSAALALFRRLGARKDAEQLERDLAALAPNPPAMTG